MVEFVPNAGEKWVGNFRRGCDPGSNSLHIHPGGRCVLIVAEGAGYLIDAEHRQLIRDLGDTIEHAWYDDQLAAFVVSDGLRFEACNALGTLWRSRRLSWDGIRNVVCHDLVAIGEALELTSSGDGAHWLPFRLDLTTGAATGGSCTAPHH